MLFFFLNFITFFRFCQNSKHFYNPCKWIWKMNHFYPNLECLFCVTKQRSTFLLIVSDCTDFGSRDFYFAHKFARSGDPLNLYLRNCLLTFIHFFDLHLTHFLCSVRIIKTSFLNVFFFFLSFFGRKVLVPDGIPFYTRRNFFFWERNFWFFMHSLFVFL